MAVSVTAAAPGYTQAAFDVTVAASVQQTSTGKTYYLDSRSGDDLNSGTDGSHAWRSIERLEQQALNPGDTVLLRRGSVWQSTLTASNSGNETGFITYADYGTGDLPRIDVSAIVGNWQSETESGFVAYYTVLKQQPHIVTANGSVLWPDVVPTAALEPPFQPVSTLMPGSYIWNPTNSRLYVRMPDDSDPSQSTVRSGITPFTFLVQQQSFIRIQNLDLEGAEYNCLRVAGGSSNIVITGNTLRFCGSAANQAAIFLDGASKTTVSSNDISYAMNMGINISGYDGNSNSSVLISHNTISHTGYDCVQVGPTFNGSITNIIVDHQTASNCGQVRSDAAGIDAYLGGSNIVFSYNTVHDGGSGPLFAVGLRFDSGTTNSTMYGNLAYHNTSGCVQLTGSSNSFSNNTCYQNNESPLYDYGEVNMFTSSESGVPSGMDVRNNMIWPSTGKHSWMIVDLVDMSVTADHNVYVLAGLAAPFNVGGTNYSLQAWQKFSRGESNSYSTSDPLLASPDGANFTPLSGSPALGTGVSSVSYTTTILGLPAGSPPNIGAF
jgi:hypothetical protein